jgi:hypothetical protein
MFRPANWPSSGATSVWGSHPSNRTTKNFIVFKKEILYNTRTPHDKPIERDYAVER